MDYVKSKRQLKNYECLIEFYKSYYKEEIEKASQKDKLEPLKKLPGQRLHFVTEARECKYDQLAFKHFLRPQYFVENINADKLDCRPEVPEGVKVRELLREYVALEDEEA